MEKFTFQNEESTEILYRVYLDTNIISRTNDFRIKEKDAKALRVISEKQEVKFFTSLKAKEEIEKTQETTQREFLLIIYNLVKKVPNTNLVESIPSTLNSVSLNVTTFNGSYNAENSLFTKLKTIFDKDDAEHIFQAEKAGMDFFLTLDKKSIIDRITQKSNEFRKIGLRINIVLPVDLVDILEVRKYINVFLKEGQRLFFEEK